jgi:alkanesulfonate monooxygenase SsuD/methylene tetrahydromethanopterin reductase-like flavin-dependent oxidoreductase (luciferase family)
MAAVTKHLAFGITASTSFEPPFLLAKRFSTLDHFTRGRIGWNIVTSWKKAAFKAIGLDNPIEHDERYRQADEYLRVLYKYVDELPRGRNLRKALTLTNYQTLGRILG